MELVALHGTIADGIIHMHCALANPQHQIIGGHLQEAKVAVLNEIVLQKLEEVVLHRRLNQKSGLKELELE